MLEIALQKPKNSKIPWGCQATGPPPLDVSCTFMPRPFLESRIRCWILFVYGHPCISYTLLLRLNHYNGVITTTVCMHACRYANKYINFFFLCLEKSTRNQKIANRKSKTRRGWNCSGGSSKLSWEFGMWPATILCCTNCIRSGLYLGMWAFNW